MGLSCLTPNLEDQVLNFHGSLSCGLLDMVEPVGDFITVEMFHTVLEAHKLLHHFKITAHITKEQHNSSLAYVPPETK